MSYLEGEWISITKAAARVHVCERTIWRWAKEGRVDSTKLLKGSKEKRLIRVDSLPAPEGAVKTPALPTAALSAEARKTYNQWRDVARQTRLARQMIERASATARELTIADLIAVLVMQESLAESMAASILEPVHV